MKPRIVLLLDFTALTAFLAAPSNISVIRLVAVITAGTLASGGAGALNSYLDEDIDRSTGRTSRLPIPQREVSPFRVLTSRVTCSLASVWFGFGLFYVVVAGLLGLGLIIVDVQLALEPTKARVWTAFKFSSPYLVIVFLAMALDVRLLTHYLV